jgi:Ni,Fe-hydrogenase III large subunit
LNWLEIKNLQSISLNEIPRLPIDDFRSQLIEKIKSGKRLVQFFADPEPDGTALYAIAADDNNSRLSIASSKIHAKSSYRTCTSDIPSAAWFEREMYEQYEIKPEGHPWLKPIRHGIAGIDRRETPYEFFTMTGKEIHEVGVGPIHAGIIEPGHFRFSCHGEKVYQLEIELGFQHRGVEDLFLKKNYHPAALVALSESIAGDTVIGHCGTFVRAWESAARCSVSRTVKAIRTIALELERIAVHVGDLSALSGDVAYLTGNSVFGALRTKVINTTMAMCGNRFGRGLLAIGGVQYDISSPLQEKILSTINELEDDVLLAGEVLFSSASILERFEKTGIIEKETAREIGMVGPAARASGVAIDVRADHPFGAYESFPVHKLTLDSGDVFARAYIRFVEIQQSIKIIRDQLNNISPGELKSTPSALQPNQFVVSLTEGWRGEISHVLLTDNDGNIKHVKIKDPSFNNWLALALAMRDEGISDFPLCNKSFNLSYCGVDL